MKALKLISIEAEPATEPHSSSMSFNGTIDGKLFEQLKPVRHSASSVGRFHEGAASTLVSCVVTLGESNRLFETPQLWRSAG